MPTTRPTAIGTSAGSTVAADLRLGRSFEDIAAQICSDGDGDGDEARGVATGVAVPARAGPSRRSGRRGCSCAR